MEVRPLEVTVLAGHDLKDVNFLTKMDVYAMVSIKGDPHHKKQKFKTPVHKDCGPNPRWNYAVKFSVDEASAQKNNIVLKFKIKAEKTLGSDREIGEIRIPIKELLDSKEAHLQHREVSYSVRTPSGKTKGTLTFSYKFGEKHTAPVPEKPKNVEKMEKPATGYPPAGYPPGAGAGYASGSSSVPYPAQGGYPPQQDGYQYPPAGGYPAPPPQHAYGGYPQQQPGYGYPPQQPGYGYPPQQPGYGYPGYPPQQPGYGGYPQVVQKPQKPKRGGGNMALGLGAGLLGGLLVGEMIDDIGDSAAGFDDGGFDF